MFEELRRFFSNDPVTCVGQLHDSNQTIFIMTLVDDMTAPPVVNELFRIGPYLFKCVFREDSMMTANLYLSSNF